MGKGREGVKRGTEWGGGREESGEREERERKVVSEGEEWKERIPFNSKGIH